MPPRDFRTRLNFRRLRHRRQNAGTGCERPVRPGRPRARDRNRMWMATPHKSFPSGDCAMTADTSPASILGTSRCIQPHRGILDHKIMKSSCDSGEVPVFWGAKSRWGVVVCVRQGAILPARSGLLLFHKMLLSRRRLLCRFWGRCPCRCIGQAAGCLRWTGAL